MIWMMIWMEGFAPQPVGLGGGKRYFLDIGIDLRQTGDEVRETGEVPIGCRELQFATRAGASARSATWATRCQMG
jgi:hypothetical protein